MVYFLLKGIDVYLIRMNAFIGRLCRSKENDSMFSHQYCPLQLLIIYIGNKKDDDDDSDASGTSSMAYGRMTARQRAKELGNDAVDELVSLPMGLSSLLTDCSDVGSQVNATNSRVKQEEAIDGS